MAMAVLQPFVEVVLAAEHRAVLGHGVGHRRCRLAEVAVEGGAVVGGAPLGTVHKGERPFKGMGHQLGAQRLTGMGRGDDQRLALEVQSPCTLRY